MAEEEGTTTGTAGDEDQQGTGTGTATGEPGAGGDADKAGDGAKPWTPPTEADWKAQQEKTKRANAQAAAARKEADELKRKGETEADAKTRTAVEEATAAAEAKWKPGSVRREARAAFLAAGLTGDAAPLLRLIDPGKVEFDDEGEIVGGLTDQIDKLRKDYAPMFGKRGSARVDGGDKRDDATATTPGGRSRRTDQIFGRARQG